MAPSLTSILLFVWGTTLALGFYLLLFERKLATETSGRVLLFAGIVVMPLATLAIGFRHALHESTRTDFCLGSCHEMNAYGQTLRVDDDEVLTAVHYQNNLVPRDRACFTCHTDYSMFGDVKAKINGLRHVYVHFLGTVPAKIEIYEPYPNANCLSCHAGARRFEGSKHHRTDEAPLAGILSGANSCMSAGCHDLVHPVADLGSYETWTPREASP